MHFQSLSIVAFASQTHVFFNEEERKGTQFFHLFGTNTDSETVHAGVTWSDVLPVYRMVALLGQKGLGGVGCVVGCCDRNNSFFFFPWTVPYGSPIRFLWKKRGALQDEAPPPWSAPTSRALAPPPRGQGAPPCDGPEPNLSNKDCSPEERNCWKDLVLWNGGGVTLPSFLHFCWWIWTEVGKKK